MLNTKNLGTLTASKLLALHDKISARQSVLCQWCIDNGLGHVTFEDMRRTPAPCPEIKEYLYLADAQADIRLEAERRYGPDGLFALRYIRRN